MSNLAEGIGVFGGVTLLEPQIDTRRVLGVLIDNLDGMVFRCAIDQDWSFHFVSQGCEALTGYPANELVEGRVSWEQLTYEEDRARVRETVMREIGAGRRYRVQYRIVSRDGRVCWVLERGSSVRDENGLTVLEGFIEDVTEQCLAERQLAEAEARYRSIFEDSVVGMFQTTVDGHYLAANQALAALYGYASPASLMSSLSDIAGSLYVDPARREDFKCLIAESGCVRDFESEIYRRDGSRIWISENAHAVPGLDGQVLYYEGTVEDITDKYRYRLQLEYQATHDPMTGLPNRNLLQDRLQQAMSHTMRHGGLGALAFIDLDNFKFVNDSLGHGAGDSLLIDMANRLRACLRSGDTLARYGGDEFVLILSECADVADVLHILQRLRDAVCQPVSLNGHEVHVDCSIGVATFPEEGQDLNVLLRHADIAMHHAKKLGKGQFQFYTDSMNTAAHERLALDNALRRAVEGGELFVVYQPKVGRDGRCSGCEALVRWHSPEFGPVSPVRFIPLAEETGLIAGLTEFVLRQACAEAAKWSADSPMKMAVNISPSLFREGELVQLVADVLSASGLPPARLELEITESMLMGDVQRALKILNELKDMGVAVAIDDFGTGYSSLAYLKRFPIDVLKVDRSFVQECDQGQEATAITRAIVSLAHSLGLRVVAEGVETQAQAAVLRALGCEEYQGYLYSKPIDPDSLHAFCKT